ncbi:MAG: hypothetical protein LC776_05265 [Acidobacteria bacterium]|nr:hypothetical protein [Acidobacteriota bacterium]
MRVERAALVNERDAEIGTEEKLRAHQLMHRAFSLHLSHQQHWQGFAATAQRTEVPLGGPLVGM